MSWNQHNPYQTQPAYQGFANQDEVRSRIYPAGVALIVVGLVGMSLMFLYLVASVIMLAAGQMQIPARNNGAPSVAYWIGFSVPFLFYLFNIFSNGLIAYAGYNMVKFKSYTFAMVGSIAAVIPMLSACCLLGIPFGIWGIVVLTGSGAKDVFQD